MKKSDVRVLGFALFAMFFGAGNLIFPPAIGNLAGKEWFLAMIGFFITGIGMPVLGIIGVIKAGGSIKDFGKHVGEKFSIVFGLAVVLILGPFMGVPRTGATTFEMGIAPLLPNIPVVLVIGIFFLLTWLLSVKQSSNNVVINPPEATSWPATIWLSFIKSWIVLNTVFTYSALLTLGVVFPILLLICAKELPPSS